MRCTFCKREFCEKVNCHGECCRMVKGRYPKCHGNCTEFQKQVKVVGMNWLSTYYPDSEFYLHSRVFFLKYSGPIGLRKVKLGSFDKHGNAYSYEYQGIVYCSACGLELCPSQLQHRTCYKNHHGHPEKYCHGYHFDYALDTNGLKADNRCDICYCAPCHLCQGKKADCCLIDRLCHCTARGPGGLPATHHWHNEPFKYKH